MKNFVSLLLVASVCGCASMGEAPSTAVVLNSSDAEASSPLDGVLHYPSKVVHDFFDLVDVNFGTGKGDYGFGMSLHATNLLRVGAFDGAELEVLGLWGAAHGGSAADAWNCDDPAFWDVGGWFGVGAGASFTFHLYEAYDLAVTAVTLGMMNPSGDHE